MKKKKQASVENAMEILVETFKPQDGYILCLKSLPANLKAYEGFQWPKIGHVIAPDWKPIHDCGNGLHAFRWGVGDVGLACMEEGAKWLVLNVKEDGIIDLGGKIKFEQCEVVYCGARDIAISIIQAHAPAGTAVMFGTATAGYKGTATAGDSGTATAGDSGTATAGSYGTATAGSYGTATAGDSGTATAGYKGTATAGSSGTATAGYKGTATAGSSGTATAGSYGTATAGYKGTATAGSSGTATAGSYGTATAGEWGILVIEYYHEESMSYRKKCAVVDSVSFLPGVKYHLKDGEFVPVNETEA